MLQSARCKAYRAEVPSHEYHLDVDVNWGPALVARGWGAAAGPALRGTSAPAANAEEDPCSVRMHLGEHISLELDVDLGQDALAMGGGAEGRQVGADGFH